MRSIIKAIRVIYPQSSSRDKNVNKTNICGINDKTDPTPEIIPSVIKFISQSAVPIYPKKFSTEDFKKSLKNLPLNQSEIGFPTSVIDIKYTKLIITANIGRAKKRFISILSILLVILDFLLDFL